MMRPAFLLLALAASARAVDIRRTGRVQWQQRGAARGFAFDYSKHGQDWTQGVCLRRETKGSKT